MSARVCACVCTCECVCSLLHFPVSVFSSRRSPLLLPQIFPGAQREQLRQNLTRVLPSPTCASVVLVNNGSFTPHGRRWGLEKQETADSDDWELPHTQTPPYAEDSPVYLMEDAAGGRKLQVRLSEQNVLFKMNLASVSPQKSDWVDFIWFEPEVNHPLWEGAESSSLKPQEVLLLIDVSEEFQQQIVFFVYV